jgi:hypothetical protein
MQDRGNRMRLAQCPSRHKGGSHARLNVAHDKAGRFPGLRVAALGQPSQIAPVAVWPCSPLTVAGAAADLARPRAALHSLLRLAP